jgi:glycosyltransferase involved in cell wall biosynthesis
VRSIGGVTVRRLPGRKARGGALNYIFDYCSFTLLAAGVLGYRHLRKRYAVVQINTMPDFLAFAAIVPKLMGTPLILFMKEPTPELAATLGRGKRYVRALERIEQLSLRFADRVITVTEQLKQRFVERGADSGKISVVLNGPDPRHLIGPSLPDPRTAAEGASLVVLCHGTIEERYGHDTILNAAALARPMVAALEIVITGSGSGVPQLLEDQARLGVEDIVRYEGWVTEQRLGELFQLADVGLVAQKPSPYSHLVHTNKMYDYWIAGLPVLASRLRATEALFSDCEIAYFDGDDPADLAEQMILLERDPLRRTELAREGRAAWRRVSWDVQRERYLDVFRGVLGSRFPRSVS